MDGLSRMFHSALERMYRDCRARRKKGGEVRERTAAAARQKSRSLLSGGCESRKHTTKGQCLLPAEGGVGAGGARSGGTGGASHGKSGAKQKARQ